MSSYTVRIDQSFRVKCEHEANPSRIGGHLPSEVSSLAHQNPVVEAVDWEVLDPRGYDRTRKSSRLDSVRTPYSSREKPSTSQVDS